EENIADGLQPDRCDADRPPESAQGGEPERRSEAQGKRLLSGRGDGGDEETERGRGRGERRRHRAESGRRRAERDAEEEAPPEEQNESLDEADHEPRTELPDEQP